MDYKDKSLEWYEEFEKKAYSLTMYYYGLKQTRKIISVAKIYLRVRKEKIKHYGKDNVNKFKIAQLKGIVKTGGLFIKPYSVKEIMKYEGVLM